MKTIQTAYIEKTGQSIKGWIEFHELFADNKSLGFFPRFYVVEALISFDYFSKIEVDNVSFTGYCGAYSIIGKEPIQLGGMNDESNVKSADGWKDR
mgnify:CR=1 FL=1